MQGLQQGGVIIERLQTRDGSKDIEAPDGLIHHWVGTVFVPRVGVKEAVALMQDYDRHSTYFAPAIARSKLLEHDGNRFRVALRFYVKKIITVTMDTENEAEFFHPYRRSRPQPHPQHPDHRDRRCGNAAGKAETARRRKRLHVEPQHLLALRTSATAAPTSSASRSRSTRDVPFALAWIIRPIVTQMPKESLTFTLAKGRSVGEVPLPIALTLQGVRIAPYTTLKLRPISGTTSLMNDRWFR